MCHKAGGMNPKDWTIFEVAKKNVDLINKRLFIDRDMPMAGELSAEEKNMIKVWISEGAPFRTDESKELTPLWEDKTLAEVRFDGEFGVRNIFKNKCSQCHNGSIHDKNWALYDVAKNNLELIKKRVFRDKDMPMVGALTSEEKENLKTWIETGAPF